MSALLELRSVSKRYGARVAVEEVSLELQPGQVFGLLGPNGAGKTTLLRICVDLLRPDAGEVRILGEKPGPGALDRVGYLPEERGLPRRVRAQELLTYVGELKGLSRGAAAAQARELLRRVQLDTRGRDRIGALSKGNQQKIQIAAALMGEPMILLVDEPFSGLDPVNRGLALELFREQVARGRAVLISTHQLEHVEQLCDRMLLLNRGRTLLSGEVRAVREQFSDGSLLVKGEGDFSALPAVLRVQGERLFLKPGATPEEALRQMLDGGIRLRSFQPALPSLEEIFVKVVAEHEAQAPAAEIA